MINERYAKLYCKDYKNIKNYNEAISDLDNMWECHHLLESDYTKNELKEMGRYFDVSADELVFCKRSEHRKYTHKGDIVMGLKHHGLKFTKEALQKMSRKGKKLSEETKRKIGEGNKGNKRPDLSERNRQRKGYKQSEETKRKISLSLKGNKRKPCSEETKRKISQSNKGKIPWNKGVKIKK